MKIKIKILPRNVLQEIEVTNGITVLELLEKIQLRPGPFVVLKNNVIIPVDYVLNDDADLSILQVISGG
ncbi:ThiS family protein [uncultured archaeon]|nr:ThiS family protein [uncultured archaeon]